MLLFSPEYVRHQACLAQPSLHTEADTTCNQTFHQQIDGISSHANNDDRVNLICQCVTPDHETSQSLETTRSVFGNDRSLWNLTRVSAVVYRGTCRISVRYDDLICQSRDFETSRELAIAGFISSAAEIVSGAYPMLSRPSSVCPSVCQPFFKTNKFSSDLSDIWRERIQQHCPKSCWSRILIFCF